MLSGEETNLCLVSFANDREIPLVIVGFVAWFSELFLRCDLDAGLDLNCALLAVGWR